MSIKKEVKKDSCLYIKLENGKTIKISSLDNYLDPEDEKYNKLFDDYVKRSSDIPKA
tara:strand:- start:687 stop:857 length:171 start_codon:yes stop_codon:yes gene_type:complete